MKNLLATILACALTLNCCRGAVDQNQSATAGAKLPKPTPEQAAWQDAELGMFIHFDIEVFDEHYSHAHPVADTNRPALGAIPASRFNPTKLDTDQWLAVAKSLGAKYAVFTAKHGSGFLMWQSDLYPYGVKQSPWRDGKGDVVRDFIASCKKYGIEPGIYCSAGGHSWWNLHHDKVVYRHGQISGGPLAVKDFLNMDLAMYADLFQRTGPLFYVWLDGGVNPFGDRIIPVLEKYEPRAVVFNGPSNGLPAGLARWSGNEKGSAPYPLWNTINTRNDQLDRGAGEPDGKYWIPVEGNVPLRYHVWIWRADDADKILSLSSLMTMYLDTVGRGCNFIINANIDSDGLVPEADARRFKEFGDTIRKWFGTSLAETNGTGNVVELKLPEPREINFVTLMEDIRLGQRIRGYEVDGLVDGGWEKLCDGESVGHKRIQQFARTKVAAIRLRVTRAVAMPLIRKLAVYNIQTLTPDPNNPVSKPGVAP
jgi:alpha-L-fucosidase